MKVEGKRRFDLRARIYVRAFIAYC